MARLTLFVASHLESELSALPKDLAFVRPVNLNDLEFEGRLGDPSLAENRFFQSSEALAVDSDFVGFVSSRIFFRLPSLSGFDEIEEAALAMRENSIWAPTLFKVNTIGTLDYWSKLQDFWHPGILRFLRESQSQIRVNKKSPNGFVFLGNQFIVSRQNWTAFVLNWRRLFNALGLESNEKTDLSFRCLRCGSKRPDGYFRYGPNRKLAFIGERITSLHFAFADLEATDHKSCEIRNFAIRPKSSQMGKVLGAAANLASLAMKFRLRQDCQVCSNFNPADSRGYELLN